MTYDFSQINLQYLILTRDLARKDPVLVAKLLSVPEDMMHLLASLSPTDLAHIANIKVPLLIPHQDTWWWSRLFTAIRGGRKEEILAIIDHAVLIMPG
ncbi:MAG: flagellar transcriptional regulator FlhD [Gammaproteobacteria bacterium]|nr:flagellar transcriptional regulator FlhD [Gammaproteobacteria bacterium]